MKQLKLASGIMTVLLALSLIGAALHIYCSFDGQGQMYTAQNIAEHLALLRIPLLLWLAVTAAAAIVSERNAQPEQRSAALRIAPLPQTKRRILYVLLTVLMIIALFGCSPSRFASRDLEHTVGMLVLWIALPAAGAVVCACFLQKSGQAKPTAVSKKNLTAARCILAAIALVLLAWGYLNGGLRDVLVKAINICSECIGLG